jgi:hypothetical protein
VIPTRAAQALPDASQDEIQARVAAPEPADATQGQVPDDRRRAYARAFNENLRASIGGSKEWTEERRDKAVEAARKAAEYEVGGPLRIAEMNATTRAAALQGTLGSHAADRESREKMATERNTSREKIAGDRLSLMQKRFDLDSMVAGHTLDMQDQQLLLDQHKQAWHEYADQQGLDMKAVQEGDQLLTSAVERSVKIGDAVPGANNRILNVIRWAQGTASPQMQAMATGGALPSTAPQGAPGGVPGAAAPPAMPAFRTPGRTPIRPAREGDVPPGAVPIYQARFPDAESGAAPDAGGDLPTSEAGGAQMAQPNRQPIGGVNYQAIALQAKKAGFGDATPDQVRVVHVKALAGNPKALERWKMITGGRAP